MASVFTRCKFVFKSLLTKLINGKLIVYTRKKWIFNIAFGINSVYWKSLKLWCNE